MIAITVELTVDFIRVFSFIINVTMGKAWWYMSIIQTILETEAGR
jgi:hypothetical protein